MGINAANSMKWEEMKRMLVKGYCPREEIHKMEQELWTLTMKVSEINAYTARFNDLTVMCPTLVTPEYKKIERYIWGLAGKIKGMVIASKPTTHDSAKRIAHQLTGTEIQVGFIAESPESRMNKRKFNGKNPIQSSEERQDVATDYVATTTILVQPRNAKTRDTPPISVGAQHLQQKIKEQTLKQAMTEDEHVLSVVKLDISRRNAQS
uniref:Retrotransposon gag domain-containing protein n=1 Tax=Lactuca sativa TaxID=4236 RepID=A0A9R1VIS8_LACSA|nr:hypothetical protein LSAT_V11C500282470 [Lactuca sativa]